MPLYVPVNSMSSVQYQYQWHVLVGDVYGTACARDGMVRTVRSHHQHDKAHLFEHWALPPVVIARTSSRLTGMYIDGWCGFQLLLAG
jgi:hypothetical protein